MESRHQRFFVDAEKLSLERKREKGKSYKEETKKDGLEEDKDG